MAKIGKQKILFTTWAGEQNIESPYSGQFSSGDKIASRIIAEGLAKRGFRVHFFALSQTSRDFFQKGVHVHLIKNPIQAPRAKWTPQQILIYTPLFFELYVQKIVECIARYQIDLVMARTVHLSATGAQFASELTGKPLITTLAERDFLLFAGRKDYPPKVPAGFHAGKYYLNYSARGNSGFSMFNFEHRNRVARLFKKSAALIALSSHLISDIKKVTKRHAPAFVVPDGVGKEFFREGNQQSVKRKLGWSKFKVILCVARTSPYKRQDLLVKCFPQVLRKNPDALLVLVGNGPYYKSLVTLIHTLKLTSRIEMLGYQPHHKVSELTSAADIVVSPTDSEGLPLTLLEAMACAKPIVASRVQPYVRIIKDGKNGILASNNPNSFAKGINQILKNSDLRNQMGRAARKTARQYSWEHTIKLTDTVVRKVLNSL